jgi:hypothetical protein
MIVKEPGMTILPLSIEYLEDTHGITCIENQMVAILKYLKLPYQVIYIFSYITSFDILQLFRDGKI